MFSSNYIIFLTSSKSTSFVIPSQTPLLLNTIFLTTNKFSSQIILLQSILFSGKIAQALWSHHKLMYSFKPIFPIFFTIYTICLNLQQDAWIFSRVNYSTISLLPQPYFVCFNMFIIMCNTNNSHIMTSIFELFHFTITNHFHRISETWNFSGRTHS